MDSSKPVDFKDWITLKAAYDLTRAATKDVHVAATSLLHRLADGVLTGAAEKAIRVDGGATPTETPKDKVPVSRDVWGYVLDSEAYPSTWAGWKSSDVILEMQGSHRTTFTLKYYGVRIFPPTFRSFIDGLTEKAPAAAPDIEMPRMVAPSAKELQKAIESPRSSPKPEKQPGGRPLKEFWDDLWAAMAAALYDGSLIPDKQATIEKAMLDWAALNGHELSQQSARSRARKLFALVKKDKN